MEVEMHRVALLVLLSLFASCGRSAESSRFEKLARRANPSIVAMRVPVGVVLDPNQADIKALRKACSDAIDLSAPLAMAGFKDFGAAEGRLGVEDVLYAFTHQKEVMCREDEGDGTRDARCRKWCVSMLTDMADAIGRAHDAAAKENVQLELLRN